MSHTTTIHFFAAEPLSDDNNKSFSAKSTFSSFPFLCSLHKGIFLSPTNVNFYLLQLLSQINEFYAEVRHNQKINFIRSTSSMPKAITLAIL